MQLVHPSAQTDIKLLSLTSDLCAHLSEAAAKLNAQSNLILGMSDEQLSAWLKSKGADVGLILEAHIAAATAVNTALEIASTTATASGAVVHPQRAESRTLIDRLSDQGRQLNFETLTISAIPQP